MQKYGIDCFYSENPLDFKYLIQFQASKGILFVHENEVTFFADGRYFEKAQLIPSIRVLPYEEASIIEFIQKQIKGKKFAFSGKDLSYDRGKELVSKLFFGSEQNYISCDLVEKLRMIKDDDEIRSMRQACQITRKGLDQIDWNQHESEWELSQRYKQNILQLGAENFAFEPIFAFDQHAAIPHHRSEKKKGKPSNVILMDVGAIYEGYHGDMTKTFLLPTASQELKQLYDIVKEGYYLILDQLKLGMIFEDLNHKIIAHFKKYHVDHLFLHSLGHGIGLEIHEAPFYKNHPSSKLPIEENMIFTVEPGLYDPRIGGIRLENTILMTKSGPESLTGLNF